MKVPLSEIVRCRVVAHNARNIAIIEQLLDGHQGDPMENFGIGCKLLVGIIHTISARNLLQLIMDLMRVSEETNASKMLKFLAYEAIHLLSICQGTVIIMPEIGMDDSVSLVSIY